MGHHLLKNGAKKRPRKPEAPNERNIDILHKKTAVFSTLTKAAKAGDLRGFWAKLGTYPGSYKRPGEIFATVLHKMPQKNVFLSLFQS